VCPLYRPTRRQSVWQSSIVTDADIFLSTDELEQLCRPHRRADARKRFLERESIRFIVGASGQPLVFRSQFITAARHASQTAREPDAQALKALFAKARR